MSHFIPDKNVSLKERTTLQVGGEAEYFFSADTKDSIQAALTWARENEQPVTILSGGSNVLVPDSGISGLVLHINTKGVSYTTAGDGFVTLTAQAGEVFDQVVQDTVSKGVWGLENLSAIPGSVGATPIQNVGAYGVEVKDLIKEVEVLDKQTGKVSVWSNQDCQFGYRDSYFKQNPGRYIVLAVVFLLRTTPTPILEYPDLASLKAKQSISQEMIRKHVCTVRARKFPDWQVVGTAGSFFKNPLVNKAMMDKLQTAYPELPIFPVGDGLYKVSLGWILDRVCNVRGYTKEAVGLYVHQALVLVNYGDATEKEILEFVDHIKTLVQDRTGLTPELEVTRL